MQFIRALALAIPAFIAASARADGVFEDVKFDEACRRAAAAKKLVFIDFYTDWCGPCKVMDKTTFVDERVVAALRARTIPIKVDAEADAALARRFNVDGYPMMLLVRPDGTEAGRIAGFQPADDFLDALDAAISGKDAETRAREAVAAGGGTDAMARLRLGQVLAAKGRHGDALAEFLWCFDAGATRDPAFMSLRRGVLLDAIAALGREYGPALAEISRRRDALEGDILAGRADFAAVLDYSAIHRALQQTDRTLATFDKLPDNSAAKVMLFADLVDALLAARRYADVVRMADPAAGLSRKIEDFHRTEADPRIRSDSARQMLLTTMREDIRRYAARMTLALAGAGRLDDARKLIADALAFDGGEEMRREIRDYLDGTDVDGAEDLRRSLLP
ncbi:MAG: DUF255 domain-containing protein [Phycisphaerales bacterium]|nr:MAG: DUF255 domain-containing protein [Phycisphaerales bacterium]